MNHNYYIPINQNKIFLGKIIAFVIIALSITSGYSQTFTAGILGGMNLARLEESGLNFNKPGFTAGGKVENRSSKYFSTEFQILYTQKGYRYLGDTLYILQHNIRLNYVEVPLLATYHFQKNKFAISCGLSYARLTSSMERINNMPVTSLEQPKKNDVLFNIYLKLPFTKQAGILVGYSHGLIEVLDDERNTLLSCKLYWETKN